jgi:pimeloyl-ACP methyl ester carboxylesterase
MEMYYEVLGQGDPLVLLHGFSGTGNAWRFPLRQALSKKYLLIIPDLRGHGHSTNPSGEFTHRQASLDICALLDDLQIEKCKAMGFSTGGMTLLHMATQQPERIEAMILLSATHYFPEQARKAMRKSTVESLTEKDYERERRFHIYGDEQIRMLQRQFHNFKDSYDDMNFTPPFLSSITARTLIVHGDRDWYFPVFIPVEMYQSIPNSYLWIVPNGGHGPIYLSEPEFFVKTALKFLEGAWENRKAN